MSLADSIKGSFLQILASFTGLVRPLIPLGGREDRKAIRNLSNLDFLLEACVHYRWMLTVPIVLPLSFVFHIGTGIYTWLLRRWHYVTGWNHSRRVRHVRDQIIRKTSKGSNTYGEGLVSGRPDYKKVCLRDSTCYKKKNNSIDVPLNQILGVDKSTHSVWVEPYVTVKELNDFLIPKGLTLPIVADLDELTVGGLFIGYGIESSSHIHGLFADIVRGCDVVIGDGSLMRCSPTENEDLFRALPWSHGSLGICTAIELQVIPAKKFVRVVYEPCRTEDAFFDRLQALTRMPPSSRPHFIEGLKFSKDTGVMMFGHMTDEVLDEGKFNDISRWYKAFFYEHVKQIGKESNGPVVEYLPLQAYYHRHNRSLFWEIELLIPFGNHPLFRLLAGWMMPLRLTLLKIFEPRFIRQKYFNRHVVQDFLLPIDKAKEFCELGHEMFNVYPIWVCPHLAKKITPQGLLHNPVVMEGGQKKEVTEEMFVDIGYYGVPQKVLMDEPWDAVRAVRTMEAWLRKNRGYQALYAVTEMRKDEFWQMFSKSLYDKCREKYHAEGVFMDIYEKLRRRA